MRFPAFPLDLLPLRLTPLRNTLTLILRQNLMKNLDDASDELLMVDDEEEPVPFMVADVFFHTPLEETKVRQGWGDQGEGDQAVAAGGMARRPRSSSNTGDH